VPFNAFARLGQREILTLVFSKVRVTEEAFAEAKPILEAAQSLLIQRCTALPSHFELALHVAASEVSAIAAAAEAE